MRRLEAAFLLNVDERTITKTAKKIRREGIAGIKHGNSKKIPHNKTSAVLLGKAVSLYEEKYYKISARSKLWIIGRSHIVPLFIFW